MDAPKFGDVLAKEALLRKSYLLAKEKTKNVTLKKKARVMADARDGL